MNIRIELKLDVQADLAAQAARSGMPLDEYVRMVLEQHVSPAKIHALAMTPAERAQAFEDWVRNFPYRRTEPLPDEAITRESFYSRADE
jgi:hypothetical protein